VPRPPHERTGPAPQDPRCIRKAYDGESSGHLRRDSPPAEGRPTPVQ
jgi:hypothetical protein